MALVTSDFLSALLTNYRAIFKEQLSQKEREADYKPFTLEVQSDRNKESYNWLEAVPAMSEWIDERKVFGISPQFYEITNKNWESTFAVDRNTIEDEQYGMIQGKVRQLADRALAHISASVYKALNLGATDKTYDGVEFFANTRSFGDSGNIDNILTGDYSADTTKIKAALRSILSLMSNYCDSRGEPLGLRPDTIICNPSYEVYFREAVLPSVAGTTSPYGDLINKIIGTPHLTSGSNKDWIVVCSTSGLKPVLLQIRSKPELVALDSPKTDTGFFRRLFHYGCDYRGAVALLEPRTAILVDCD
jgi:phage major head subunit gpT-like protein